MAVVTVSNLLSRLSTGGSADNGIETSLMVDLVDTLNDIATTGVASTLASGEAIVVLPDADPTVVGALWNDAGTITVSAG